MRFIQSRVFLTAALAVVLGCGGCAHPPTGLAYSSSQGVYRVGVEIVPDKPMNAGGGATSYGIVPDLPAGLSLSTSTGVITGVPTTPTAMANYVVTASNTDGNATATIAITVTEGVAAQDLPNLGRQITPLAPVGARFEPMTPDMYAAADSGPDGSSPGLAGNPVWLVDHPVTSVVSPDHLTMLVLTSGFNRYYDPATGALDDSKSTEYIFVYDISQPEPVKTQVLKISNAYHGIVFDPAVRAFYVAGNVDVPVDGSIVQDDIVHVYAQGSGGPWTAAADGVWTEQKGSLDLGHTGGGVGLGAPPPDAGPETGIAPVNSQIGVQAMPAGAAMSSDGKILVIANYYNDSTTVFTGGYGAWSKGQELDLRPGRNNDAQSGVPGGEYPFWVAIKGTGAGAVAYIASIRDREIVMVGLNGKPSVLGRIPVKGQPNKMILNAAQTLLYVPEDQSDTVDVIDTSTNTVIETIPVIAPPSVLPASLAPYRGSNTNSVTLSPDEKQLYVTNGNLNNVAVVALTGTNSGDQVIGLIPTGWYPNSVSFSGDGKTVYVINGKSPTGPNPGNCYVAGPPSHPGAMTCLSANQYDLQLTKGGIQTFPRPSGDQLPGLTAQVATNNHFAATESPSDAQIMAAVRSGIKHVIFILKENRTYDQILGDLEVGNGDPDLAEFGEPITPNLHNLARTFVTLDNFYDSAEVTNGGWPWSTSAQAPDVLEHQIPVCYAGRGLSVDSEGNNRSVAVGIPTLAGRIAENPIYPNDPDLLPGTTDNAAPDGPDGEINTGYLWDNALRAKLSVRNYGFLVDGTRYALPSTSPGYIPPTIRNPFAQNIQVAFSSNTALSENTDPYFRGFDNAFPDYYRFQEWARELQTNYGNGNLPALSLVRFMHDHTGNFAGALVQGTIAIDGIDTPEYQQSDNDYAVGLLIQTIAASQYANDTLIFVLEDDSQDGGDHVDAHRSIAFVAGAYVKQGTLVSSQYNTVNFVRTIEEVLGLPPMNLNDAVARPMADVFNTTPSAWTFTATVPPLLCNAQVTLQPPPPCNASSGKVPGPTHDSKYWGRVTKGMDFSSEDKFDFAQYNRVLWKGLMGNRPYPAGHSGKDLRKNREQLLANYHRAKKATPVAQNR